MPTTSSNDEAAIRERLERWTQALHDKDLDALMALYAPDVVTFDLMPPSQVRGTDRYRRNFEHWFAALPGPIDYRTRDLRVVVDGNVAFCHGLSHVGGIRADGASADYWVRVTVGFEKRGGDWLMVHDHISMPVEGRDMKAVQDLRG